MASPSYTKEKKLNKEGGNLTLRDVKHLIEQELKRSSTLPITIKLNSSFNIQRTLQQYSVFPFLYLQTKEHSPTSFLALEEFKRFTTNEDVEKNISTDHYIFGSPNSYFFIPKVTLIQHQSTLTIIAFANISSEDITPTLSTPTCIQQHEIPIYDQWKQQINKIKTLIEQKTISKLVLSRRKEHKYNTSPLYTILSNLTPVTNCYTLLWAQSKNNFFISQSPETLFKRNKSTIEVDSLAGTIESSTDPHKDHQLKQQLKDSTKDLQEHRIVTDFIYERLSSLCDNVKIIEPERVISLKHLHHLKTTLQGKLKTNISDIELIQQLHPTPAIGGYPQERVKQLIPEIEQRDRNMYAAPFGFITKSTADFLITIRSAEFKYDTLSIYAGAGIVEDSMAESEWQETQNKLHAIEGLL